ncbi:AraC family transcriptional regulator [Janthinobacterium agaricidamnosum]|uniref:AraC family transcriptional regulator n=1 Tax=Janthinobacterium agaricidamnosum TaxID=55508 RepID=A0A3G2EHV9_9BURK|nr:MULTISPECIES: AraC family transcriptional regulator [Janthinobacterium]AYM78979.1 AraC family transcriptional regulator [Janthinobacterium agaricidamnosum]MCC7681580.1 helix-turn-helix transcriptional regulator [Janthinobacterium sp. FW305-128]
MRGQEREAAGWTRRQLDPGLKECRADQRQVDQGLLLVHSDYRPRLALVEQSQHDDGGGMVITIGLEGASAYATRDGEQLRFQGGHTTMTVFRHVSGERRFEAHQRAAQLRVLVDEDALARYWPEGLASLLPHGGARQLAHAATTAAATLHARSLLRATDPLAVHISVLSILAEQLRGLRPAPVLVPRWSEADIVKLERVYALMQEQMAQALTLDYLCAQAGLSLFKLKQGWRYRYNDSPQRTLLALRMQRAKLLLENGCQVAQAGWQTGYRHPANFSAAFSRYFGYAPKTVGRAGA